MHLLLSDIRILSLYPYLKINFQFLPNFPNESVSIDSNNDRSFAKARFRPR